MAKKISITYTVNEEKLYRVFAYLISEDCKFTIDEVLNNLEAKSPDVNKTIKSIGALREKLFDIDSRLQEVSSMLEEYSLKKDKSEGKDGL